MTAFQQHQIAPSLRLLKVPLPLFPHTEESHKHRFFLPGPHAASVALKEEVPPYNCKEALVEKTKVLFICVHNSGRSQMAEAFLNAAPGERFLAESAGLEPRDIHPLVVEVMKEIGFDLSGKKADSVFEFFKEGRLYDFVITVCDETTEKRCPLFPGVRKRLRWPFTDPEKLSGSRDEKLEQLREIRDRIRRRVEDWIKNPE